MAVTTSRFAVALVGSVLLAPVSPIQGCARVEPNADRPGSLKALLVIGGRYHDYAAQKDILKAGIEQRANVRVTVVYDPDQRSDTPLALYDTPGWARGYDVVIHDECKAEVTDTAVVRRILAAHRAGIPAVNLHCAMHSYRTGTSDWFAFTGLNTHDHGPKEPIALRVTDASHPITRGLTSWTTVGEELYNNLQLFPTMTPLVRGAQVVIQPDGRRRTDDFVVAWTNDYHGTRVFSTTLGHETATVRDGRYLDLVTRGLLWAAGKLADDGTPAAGYGPAAAARP